MPTSQTDPAVEPIPGAVHPADRIPNRPMAWAIFPIVALLVGGVVVFAVAVGAHIREGKVIGHDIYPAPQFGDELRCEIFTRTSLSAVTAEVAIRVRDTPTSASAWETQQSVTYLVGDRTPVRYMVVWMQDDANALTGVEVFATMRDNTVMSLGTIPLDGE